MKKNKTELQGGNVTLRQLLVAAQKMARAIRVEKQNPGQEGGWAASYLGILRCLKEKLLVYEKRVKGKGAEEEWDRNVYTDISQLAAQGFLTYFESEKETWSSNIQATYNFNHFVPSQAMLNQNQKSLQKKPFEKKNVCGSCLPLDATNTGFDVSPWCVSCPGAVCKWRIRRHNAQHVRPRQTRHRP